MNQVRELLEELPRSSKIQLQGFKRYKSKCFKAGSQDCNYVLYGKNQCINPKSLQTKTCQPNSHQIKAFEKNKTGQIDNTNAWLQFRMKLTRHCKNRRLSKKAKIVCKNLESLSIR